MKYKHLFKLASIFNKCADLEWEGQWEEFQEENFPPTAPQRERRDYRDFKRKELDPFRLSREPELNPYVEDLGRTPLSEEEQKEADLEKERREVFETERENELISEWNSEEDELIPIWETYKEALQMHDFAVENNLPQAKGVFPEPPYELKYYIKEMPKSRIFNINSFIKSFEDFYELTEE